MCENKTIKKTDVTKCINLSSKDNSELQTMVDICAMSRHKHASLSLLMASIFCSHVLSFTYKKSISLISTVHTTITKISDIVKKTKKEILPFVPPK